MDKSVIISIRGTQTLDDNPPETVELITEGRLIDCGEEGYTLTYQESELTGLEGTLTTFHAAADGRIQFPDGLSAGAEALFHV